MKSTESESEWMVSIQSQGNETQGGTPYL